MRYLVNGGPEVTKQLAKRVLKLAWDKSKVVGMGILQDRGSGLSEDEVWGGCGVRTIIIDGYHATGVDADYVHGRMMKLSFTFGDNHIAGNVYTRQWTPDYQSFCLTYPNFDTLVRAAATSLGVNVLEVT